MNNEKICVCSYCKVDEDIDLLDKDIHNEYWHHRHESSRWSEEEIGKAENDEHNQNNDSQNPSIIQDALPGLGSSVKFVTEKQDEGGESNSIFLTWSEKQIARNPNPTSDFIDPAPMNSFDSLMNLLSSNEMDQENNMAEEV